MSRLVVLTTVELAVGYRLGGASTVVASSTDDAQTLLSELLVREDGVIAVHAPYYDGFSRLFRRRIDGLSAPLVVPLPAGESVEQSEERRERLVELLRAAIGYEITFGEEGTHQ